MRANVYCLTRKSGKKKIKMEKEKKKEAKYAVVKYFVVLKLWRINQNKNITRINWRTKN